ncbi:cathepsin A [Vigna unguiculata]|uniref:Cathepsin A n=1 Tax=Vigna unguiculata TaxID=3917 RepID=A0A4D6KM08_VIGUN|nr:cathepsin A [Vigna unguiculata]
MGLGTGCSSLGVGALSENGAFRPNGKVLIRNEYKWNRVGVGFSYAIGGSSYETVNDETTDLGDQSSDLKRPCWLENA